MIKNIVAVAVLLVLGAAVFFLFKEKPEVDVAKEKATAVLSPVDISKLTKLEIIRHDGSGSTLREEHIIIKKFGDDDWRMVKPVEYNVIMTSVNRMLDVLKDLRIIDVISENKKKHHVLEVDGDLGVEVTAFAGDSVLAHFIVGLSRDNMTFVRLPGADTVYRTHGTYRNTFNKSVKNLRDRVVIHLDKDSVTRATFTNERGILDVERKDADGGIRYLPVEAEVKNFDWRKAKGAVNAIVALTTRDYADEPLADDITGLGEGAARVEFEATNNGKVGKYTIWFGKTDENKRLTYAKTSVSDQIFLIAAHIAARFITDLKDYERTDEQVVAQEKQRKAAEEHAAMHRQHAEQPSRVGAPADNQQIPPDIMKKLRAQMKAQESAAPQPDNH